MTQVVEEKGVTMYKDSYGLTSIMLNEATFFEILCSYAKESTNDETVELLQPYLNHPLFTVEQAKKASPVAAALLQWVKAVALHHSISVRVRPRIKELERKQIDYALVIVFA